MIFERGKWMLDLSEDYSQFFRGDNWFTFRVLQVEFENDIVLGCYEATFVLFGLGARIVYEYDPNTETRQIIKERFDEVLDRHKDDENVT